MKRLPSALALIGLFWTPALPAQAERIPLFDAHIHYSGDAWEPVPVSEALMLLDEGGIVRGLASSTPDDGTLRLYEAAPQRIVPELRPYRTPSDVGNWHRDPTIVPYLEQRLKRGIYKGIGEFHLHGDEARSEVVRQVVALAVKHDLVLHAHSDDKAVELLFAIDPKAKVMWAHAGMSATAETVGRMLDRYPGLWVELAIRSDVAPGGTLDPAWRAMFLRHPDRFMYGTDTYTPGRWPQLPAIADNARRWLGELPREVAEKIAFRNGDTLFPP